jgi:beta-lactam-binding protein with PASTA domain
VRDVNRILIALTTAVALLSAPTGIASAAPSAAITIPDVVNQNARVAQAKLTNLGLTNVDFASATTKYQNVFNPSNWTVVGVEPAVGTAVAAGDPVILKVTKP